MEESEPKKMDVKDRIKVLTNYASSIEVDFNVSAVRYFRSGQEMTRMAKVYLEENNLEPAYILCIKFMTLFIEKIKKHPGYNTVPTQLKETIMAKVKEVMPIAEKLKQQLLQQYTLEYKRYLDERKQEEKKKEKLVKQQVAETKTTTTLTNKENCAIASSVFGLDQISYPELNEETKNPVENCLPPPSCSKPTVNRSIKPKILDSSLENRIYNNYKSLRLIMVPTKIMTEFLKVANKNTQVNKETCGILGGIPKNNQFLISHLIIPKQTGTSDTCLATNEEELSEFINENNLFSLGWIHTHPTQTAFLSAVDLHTQYSHQRLLDESIAIVCAPRYSENEIFSLTQDYGLPLIGSCSESGFHTHPNEKPIYKRAEHVQLDDTLPVTVINLQ